MKKRDIFIQVNGGLGKCVAFTALLPKLREAYRTVHVRTAWPSVLEGHTDDQVKLVYVDDTNREMYSDILYSENTKLVLTDPYDTEDFIRRKAHLLDVWSRLCGIDTPAVYEPALHIPEHQAYEFDAIVSRVLQSVGGEQNFILVQLTGGQPQPSEGLYDPSGGLQRSLTFFSYIALINALKEKYPDKTILRYAHPNEVLPTPIANDVHTVQPGIPWKAYYILAHSAYTIVSIDSSLQHIAAAAKRPATVIWRQTSPEHFGYDLHDNLQAENPTKNMLAYSRLLGVDSQQAATPAVSEIIQSVDKLL